MKFNRQCLVECLTTNITRFNTKLLQDKDKLKIGITLLVTNETFFFFCSVMQKGVFLVKNIFFHGSLINGKFKKHTVFDIEIFYHSKRLKVLHTIINKKNSPNF